MWLQTQRQLVADFRTRALGALRNRLAAEVAAHQLRKERLRSVGLRHVDQQRISVSATWSRLVIWRAVAFRARLDEVATCQSTLDRAMRARLEVRRVDLQVQQAKLLELDPTAVLGRGFSLLTDERGRIVTSIGQAPSRARLKAHLNDGTIHADVVETRPRAS